MSEKQKSDVGTPHGCLYEKELGTLCATVSMLTKSVDDLKATYRQNLKLLAQLGAQTEVNQAFNLRMARIEHDQDGLGALVRTLQLKDVALTTSAAQQKKRWAFLEPLKANLGAAAIVAAVLFVFYLLDLTGYLHRLFPH